MSKTGEWVTVQAAVEEAADIALGSAEIAVKAGNKAVAAVPIPDPRDNVDFQRLAGLEQSTLARLMPRQRNRWPKLLEFEAARGVRPSPGGAPRRPERASSAARDGSRAPRACSSGLARA